MEGGRCRGGGWRGGGWRASLHAVHTAVNVLLKIEDNDQFSTSKK